MRCSGLTADRAAAIYDRSPDKMIRVCMGFAGLERGRRGLFDRDRAVVQITLNGQGAFERGEWFPADSPVRITYATYTS